MSAIETIRLQARQDRLRVTLHAHAEMTDEGFALADVLEAIETASVIEDYPEHKRGACCLIGGITRNGRPVHIVCTTSLELLVIITVYEPKPPKWITPVERRPTP